MPELTTIQELCGEISKLKRDKEAYKEKNEELIKDKNDLRKALKHVGSVVSSTIKKFDIDSELSPSDEW